MIAQSAEPSAPDTVWMLVSTALVLLMTPLPAPGNADDIDAAAQKATEENKVTLAKAAVESNDVPRIVKYGESAALTSTEDYLLLDRLAFAFLSLGGEQNAAKNRTAAAAPTTRRVIFKLYILIPPDTGT